MTGSVRGRWCIHARAMVAAVLAVLAAAAMQGAYLRNVPQTVTQPDGTVLHLFASGDERYNWLHDADGYVIVRDPETGTFVYGLKADGRLQPTAFVAGVDDPAAAGLEKGIMPDPRYLPDSGEAYHANRRARAQEAAPAPAFSLINNIVIFVRFADEPEFGDAISTYEMWFNSADTSSASLRRYFLEASYQHLEVDSTFYPAPTGATVVSYRDSHDRAYYQPYDATTNPNGYTSTNRSEREHTLLKNAVDAVSPQVPPSLNVDTDGDSFVDNLIFIVSGTPVSGEWSNLLWPHWSSLRFGYAVTATINGKTVASYDLQLNGSLGVGVLCHEMGHALGMPDLYHYDTCSLAPNLSPVGRWDLMDEGMDPPQHMGAYMKQHYLGWIGTIPLISASGTYQLNPLTSPGSNCYRIVSPNSPTEYFVVEYRKRSFPFENSVPGNGLLVYRIKEDTPAGQWGNDCGPPDEVYLYRPSGTLTANGILSNAAFTSDAGRTAIDDTTSPSSFLSTGYPGGLSISNVGAAGASIAFTVNIQSPCSKPGAFTLVSPANGASVPADAQVTLSWAASAGASSYDIYFGTDPNPGLLGNQTDTTRSVSVTAGASYFWKVVAKNSCGESAASEGATWAFNAGGSGGITILSDDFEGSFPGQWDLYGVNGYTGGAMWGKVSCKTNGGSGAAWCAAGGSEPQPPCTTYIADHGTFLIYGPFNLSDASEGTLDFDAWYDINDGGDPANATDWAAWLFSVDGQTFPVGYAVTGTSQGWEHVTVTMSDIRLDDGTALLGKPQVWLGFVFVSSAATTPREGAYIDNVVLKKTIGQPGPPRPRVRRHLPRE
jgi:M6 family metalloprotease-like protein